VCTKATPLGMGFVVDPQVVVEVRGFGGSSAPLLPFEPPPAIV